MIKIILALSHLIIYLSLLNDIIITINHIIKTAIIIAVIIVIITVAIAITVVIIYLFF